MLLGVKILNIFSIAHESFVALFLKLVSLRKTDATSIPEILTMLDLSLKTTHTGALSHEGFSVFAQIWPISDTGFTFLCLFVK